MARFRVRHCSLLPPSLSSPPQRAWTFQKQGLGHLPGKKREREQYTWKDQESLSLHPSQVSQKPARGVSLYPLPFLASYDYNQQREEEREIERAGEEGEREGRRERRKVRSQVLYHCKHGQPKVGGWSADPGLGTNTWFLI